jgi:hypothetical protein
MCDNCKNENNEEINEIENDTYETQEEQITTDDRFVELEIGKEIERLEREEGYFEGLNFSENKDETFKEIVRDGEAYANFYSHLVLSGVHSDTAGQLLMNYMTCRHNVAMGKLDIEKAKHQNIQLQTQTL